MKTVRDHLTGALENLQSDNLKKFKAKLNEFPVKKSCENIPKGVLEKADVLDLVQRLLDYYGEKYAVELTVKILKFINCKDQAEKLHRESTKNVHVSVQTRVRSASASSRRNGPTLKSPKSDGCFTSPPVRSKGMIPSATMPSSTKSSASKASKVTKTTTSSSVPKASTSTLAALKATPGSKRSALKSSSSRASCSTATKCSLTSRPLAQSSASCSSSYIGNSSTWGSNVATRFNSQEIGIGNGGNPLFSDPYPLMAQQQPPKKAARGRQPGSRAVKTQGGGPTIQPPLSSGVQSTFPTSRFLDMPLQPLAAKQIKKRKTK